MQLKLIITLTFIVIYISSSGQKGYYVINSTYNSGVKIIDAGDLNNSKHCIVVKDNKTIEYTPDEVSEYGFLNGKNYISGKIKINNSLTPVFLERLVNGKESLFYYRAKKSKVFFIEGKDSSLIQIPGKKNDYKIFLQDYLNDCPNMKDAARLVSFNKNSLKYLIKRYNTCETKSFPFTKYGIIAGYEIPRLKPNLRDAFLNLEDMNIEYGKGYTIGAFFDKPLYFSNSSIHAELQISKEKILYYLKNENRDVDIMTNLLTVNIPVLFRYTIPSIKYRPFFNAGGIFAINLKKESKMYEAQMNHLVVEISDITNQNLISGFQSGFAIGFGCEVSLSYRKSLSFEIRHNNLYGLTDSNYLNRRGFQFITGINF